MPSDSFAYGGFKTKMRANLRGQFSLRRARRVHLVLYEQPGRPDPRRRAAGSARAADVELALSNGASLGRSSVRCGSGDHRIDGPRAWTVRTSSLVVAQPPQHPRKRKAI